MPDDIESSFLQDLEAESNPQDGATPKEEPRETPAEAPQKAEDPEIEVIPGKKFKRSQILEFEKGYMLNKDYTQKTQKLAQQQKEMEELQKFGDFLKSNPQKLQRVLQVLDEKEDAIREQKTDAQQELAGLDPNDPYAQMIKQHLGSLNKQLESVTKELSSLKKQSEDERRTQEVQSAQKTLSSTLGEVAKSLEFDDEESQAVWKRMVLSELKDNPKKFADEDSFKSSIREIAKNQFDILNKLGEKRIKKYLDSKKAVTVPPATGASGKVQSKKPTMADLEDIFIEGLERESA